MVELRDFYLTSYIARSRIEAMIGLWFDICKTEMSGLDQCIFAFLEK